MDLLFKYFKGLCINISDKDRSEIKEIVEENASINMKNRLLFELDKQKPNLATLEYLINKETRTSGFSYQKPSIKSEIIRALATGIFSYVVFKYMIHPPFTSNFLPAEIIITMFLMVFSFFVSMLEMDGYNKYNKNLQVFINSKKIFKESIFNILLKNDEVKIKILKALKEKVDSMASITANKKAMRLIEDAYYDIEENLISKELDIYLLVDEVNNFFDLYNEYKDLYSKENILNKKIELEMNY